MLLLCSYKDCQQFSDSNCSQNFYGTLLGKRRVIHTYNIRQIFNRIITREKNAFTSVRARI